jgi:predicted GIY-YIG superfamily endonuclease
VVEQGTHKPLVGSSNLPPGKFLMPWIYILKGSSGRHYIGSAVDLNARLAQHRRGHTYTTKRLGENLELVASKEVATLDEARKIERTLKAKESAACHSRVTTVEQPRKLSRARDSCRSCGLIELLAQACSNE